MSYKGNRRPYRNSGSFDSHVQLTIHRLLTRLSLLFALCACVACSQGDSRFTAEEEARAKAYEAKRAVRLAAQEAAEAEKAIADREKAIAEHKIWIGMKETELQRSVGSPETKTTVADASGSLVVWDYPGLRVTVAEGTVRRYVLTK